MHRSFRGLQRRNRHVSPPSTPSAFQGERTPHFASLPQNSGFDDRAREIADKVKFMSDSEWEHLSTDEKSIFVRYTRNRLQISPSEVSEQQRRRYYETTQHKVRFNPNLITNPYQRMKSSLPFALDTHGRQITVSEAMMETGDESRFEPQQAKHIEYAQIHFKQIFKDYIENRRAGVSTEAERRKIASMAESLHHMVQSHLANMYKYADCRLHEAVKKRAKARLESLESTKKTILSFMQSGDATVFSKSKKSSAQRAAMYGLDAGTQKTIAHRLRAQEEFLERLEVLNCLTAGKGFAHSEKDERLDAYADRTSALLSLDAENMGKVDAVQYFAKLESCEPIDWAKRWYEENLIYPLEAIPEYAKLKSLVELHGNDEGKSATQRAAQSRIDSVTNFTSLLFSGKESDSLQHRRMRHLAFSFMQSQINRMRAKAVKYKHIDMEKEKETVADRLKQIEELGGDLSNEAVCQLHKEIQECVSAVMQRCRDRFAEETSGYSKADTKERIVSAVQRNDTGALKDEVDRLRLRKKAEATLRLIRTLEEDVKADYKWYSLFEEAERPPQIPLPLPSMYVSAHAAQQFRDIEKSDESIRSNPFEKNSREWKVSFYGTDVAMPTKPIIFWGTGVKTVHQALAHAAEIARQKSIPHGMQDENLSAPDASEGSERPQESNPWAWRPSPQGIDALP